MNKMNKSTKIWLGCFFCALAIIYFTVVREVVRDNRFHRIMKEKYNEEYSDLNITLAKSEAGYRNFEIKL